MLAAGCFATDDTLRLNKEGRFSTAHLKIGGFKPPLLGFLQSSMSTITTPKPVAGSSGTVYFLPTIGAEYSVFSHVSFNAPLSTTMVN